MKTKLLFLINLFLLSLFFCTAGCTHENAVSANAGNPSVGAGAATAKDFSLTTLRGETFTLSDYRGKKIIVLGVGHPFG